MDASSQLKDQSSFIFNGKEHTEQDIIKVIEEIIKIKNISSQNCKTKLKNIFIKSNNIIKCKKQLKSFYEAKIDKNNLSHMKMLYDIWSSFNENDKNIKEIDDKWRKLKFIFILIIIFFNKYS